MTVHSHIYLLKNIHLFKQIYRVLYIFTMIKIFCIFLKLKINCSYMRVYVCVYLFLYHWIGKYANIFVIFQNSYFLFYVFFFFFGLFYLFCVFLVKFLYIFFLYYLKTSRWLSQQLSTALNRKLKINND